MTDDEQRHVRLAAAAFDQLPSQIAVIDTDGVIRATNRAWETFGLENGVEMGADMVGQNYLSVCRATPDELSTLAADGIEAVIDEERPEFSFEYPCHSPDKQRWFTMRARRFEFDGEPLVIVIHTDITERHLAEADVADRNETLSMVAGILSHDLRNPLSVAMARAEMTDGDHSAVIQRSLTRMRDILDDALVLARKTDLESVSAVRLDTSATDAWEQVTTEGATLVVESEATIEADASLLAQLFENLFRNALDHGGPDVTVTVADREDGFAVVDDGPGLPADDRERVFEPGFTTNQAGGGTGLGLTIVKHVADVHGWSVEATDAPDGGAMFVVSGVSRAND